MVSHLRALRTIFTIFPRIICIIAFFLRSHLQLPHGLSEVSPADEAGLTQVVHVERRSDINPPAPAQYAPGSCFRVCLDRCHTYRRERLYVQPVYQSRRQFRTLLYVATQR